MGIPVGIIEPLGTASALAAPTVCASLRASVKADLCKACGECERTCAAVFEVAAGAARIKVVTVPRESEDLCIDALESCPNGAISVREI